MSAQRNKNIHMHRRRVSRHLTTYANQRGIKLVKYHPETHDPLLENAADWCRNHVSQEKLTEIFDQVRNPADVDNDVLRRRLKVYVATAFTLDENDEKQLTVIGVVAFATMLSFDYLYSNVRVLKKALLALSNAQYKALFPGMSKTRLRKRAANEALLNDIGEDDQFPTFDDIDFADAASVRNVGELLLVCVNPDVLVRGVGRYLIAKSFHEMFVHYGTAFAELGTYNGRVNPAMQRILEEFGFEEAEATFSYPQYGIDEIDWTDANGNHQYFFTYEIEPLTFEFIQEFLNLDQIDLGAKTCTRSASTQNYTHATNGTKYVRNTDALAWMQYCGPNKGYSNTYSGNYH